MSECGDSVCSSSDGSLDLEDIYNSNFSDVGQTAEKVEPEEVEAANTKVVKIKYPRLDAVFIHDCSNDVKIMILEAD